MASVRATSIALILLWLSPSPLEAQNDTGRFLLGAAASFGLHEAGHVASTLAFGGSPGIRRVEFGPIPFFAVTHGSVSPAGEYVISSAGFWTQQITSESILSRYPNLRSEEAPFLKGMLSFHLLISAGYSAVAFAEEGPRDRDTRGMAESVRMSEPAIGVVILAPAVFDGLRYFFPENEWLRWVGRAVKAGGVLLLLRTEGSTP